MRKIIYTLILCFFALNLSAQYYAYIVSNDANLMSSVPEVGNIDYTISATSIKNKGNYKYAYRLEIPADGIEVEFTFKSGEYTSNEIYKNKVYNVIKQNEKIIFALVNYSTFTIQIECQYADAFLGLSFPNDTYHSISTSGKVRTYTFYNTFSNTVTLQVPYAFWVDNHKITGYYPGKDPISFVANPNSYIVWNVSYTASNKNGDESSPDHGKLQDRYYTSGSGRFSAIEDINITKNSSDPTHIGNLYLNTNTFGKVTYSTTYTKSDVEGWLWISCPFDATITVKVGTTNISLTYAGDPKENYKHACYQLNSFSSKIRAEKGTGYWVAQKTNTLKAGEGYILGIDPRSLTGNITVTYTSINSRNENKASHEVTLAENISNYNNCSNQHLIGTGLYYSTDYFGGNILTNNPCYVAIPPISNSNTPNWKYTITNNNTVYTLEPFKAYFFQFNGYISMGRSYEVAKAPMARSEEKEKTQLEQYTINLNGLEWNEETTILMNPDKTEENLGFLYFTENVDGIAFANQFYSIDQEEPQSFNYRKKENQAISLGGCLANAGDYTISLKGTNTTAKSVLLTDTYDGTTTELTTDSYTFSVNDSVVLNNRFIVTFSFAPDMPTDTYITEANQIIVYGNADNCNISNLTTDEIVMIYDATGRLVYNQIAQTDNLNITLIPGTYIVRQADKWTKFNIANR